ncbi:MAG: YCF48-related protein [Ignavibacteriaceae bacterium]
MKTASITILLFAFFSLSLFAQSNWYAQNSGVNRELTGVYFVDENNGWICGWTGTILHTTDGGQTWNPQTCPPTNAYYSVFFTDSQHGWATGYYGKLVHTSDGGQTWEIQPSPTTSDIYSVYFINSNEGWAAGGDYGSFPSYIKHRVILHTTNGGNS